MKLDLTALQKANVFLSEAVANAGDPSFMNMLNKSQNRLVIAGVIKNFGLTYELSWKFIKGLSRNSITCALMQKICYILR